MIQLRLRHRRQKRIIQLMMHQPTVATRLLSQATQNLRTISQPLTMCRLLSKLRTIPSRQSKMGRHHQTLQLPNSLKQPLRITMPLKRLRPPLLMIGSRLTMLTIQITLLGSNQATIHWSTSSLALPVRLRPELFIRSLPLVRELHYYPRFGRWCHRIAITLTRCGQIWIANTIRHLPKLTIPMPKIGMITRLVW